ncbi:hypothetical protein V8G54_028005, partial [Vigna mungo]
MSGPRTSKVGRPLEDSKKTLSPFSLRFNERNSFFKCFAKDRSDIPFMSTACPLSIICKSCFKSLPTLGNSLIISVTTVSGRTLGCSSSSSEELEESSESWSLFLFFLSLSLLFLLRSSFSPLFLRRSFSRRRRRRREEWSESDDDEEDEEVDESCRRRCFFLLSPIFGILSPADDAAPNTQTSIFFFLISL